MNRQELLHGTVHTIPADLKKAVESTMPNEWNQLTPLARNEWICWVESAKLADTRARRITRTHTELAEGKHRPCCWPGCPHREKNGT